MNISFKSYWNLLSDHIRPQKRQFILLACMLFGSIALRILAPQIMRSFIDSALAGKSLFLTRPSLHHFTHDPRELAERAGDVLRLIAGGSLKLAIDRTLPLERAAEAHRLLESRATSGKLLLIP